MKQHSLTLSFSSVVLYFYYARIFDRGGGQIQFEKKKVNLSGWEWVEPAFHAEKNDVTFDVVANVTMGVSGLAIQLVYTR